MTEFKQIVGRGTRVREDKEKLFFTILDYTGSATRNFADPEFDGEPPWITEEEIDGEGNVIDGGEWLPGETETTGEGNEGGEEEGTPSLPLPGGSGGTASPVPPRQKFYISEGEVSIAAVSYTHLDVYKRQRIF